MTPAVAVFKHLAARNAEGVWCLCTPVAEPSLTVGF